MTMQSKLQIKLVRVLKHFVSHYGDKYRSDNNNKSDYVERVVGGTEGEAEKHLKTQQTTDRQHLAHLNSAIKSFETIFLAIRFE